MGGWHEINPMKPSESDGLVGIPGGCSQRGSNSAMFIIAAIISMIVLGTCNVILSS